MICIIYIVQWIKTSYTKVSIRYYLLDTPLGTQKMGNTHTHTEEDNEIVKYNYLTL